MGRLGRYIPTAILLSLIFGIIAHSSAPPVSGWQEWTDNQSGVGQYQLYNVTDVSVNNLIPGGPVYSETTGHLVNTSPFQSQLIWYVDPQSLVHACSDSNTGLTNVTALCSMKELARRVNGSYYYGTTGVAAYLLSDMSPTDAAVLSIHGAGLGPSSNLSPIGFDAYFMIIGVPTVVYSGTMSSVQNATAGGTTDGHFTDSSIPVSFTASGYLNPSYIYKDTTSGVYFWWMKDLGSKVLRVSQGPLTSGDSYSILKLPKINGIRFDPEQVFYTYQVDLVDDVTVANEDSSRDRLIYGIDSFESQVPRSGVFYNDHFITPRSFAQPSSDSGGQIISGALQGNGSALYSLSGWWELSAESSDFISIEAATLVPDEGANLIVAHLMFYDVTGTMVFSTSPTRSTHTGIVSLGGASNTGKIASVSGVSTNVAFAAVPSGSITSSATLYALDNITGNSLPMVNINTGNSIQYAPASDVPVSGCLQAGAGGYVTSTGVPCIAGFDAGAPIAVTGVPPIRVDAGAVALVGGYVSGSTSTTAQNLSAQSSGYVKDDKDGGVAQLYTVATIPASDITGLPSAPTGVDPIRVDAGAVGVLGAVVNGSPKTTAKQNLGAGNAGTLQQTIDGGVATVSEFAGTAASIPFYATNNQLAQDNTNLHWDNSNKYLGLGTTTPAAQINLVRTAGAAAYYSSATDSGSGTFSGFIVSNTNPITTNYLQFFETGSSWSVAGAWPASAGALDQNGVAGLYIGTSNMRDIHFYTGASRVDKFQVQNAGNELLTNMGAPGTPASGFLACYGDLTSKNLACKNDAGTVNHGIQTITCGANTFGTATTDAGGFTCTQPTIGNLANIPANTVVGNPTGSSAAPSALTLGGGLTNGGSSLTMSWCTAGEVLMSAGPGVAPTCANPGGDLSGTYPSPSVNGFVETSGPQDLKIGPIGTPGYVLVRDGSNQIVGSNPLNLLVRARVTNLPYFLGFIGGFGIVSNAWTPSGGNGNAGPSVGASTNPIEYGVGFAAGIVRAVISIQLGGNSLSGSGVSFYVTQNGLTVATVAVPPSSGTMFFDSGDVSVTGASTDTFGLKFGPTGTITGGTLSATINVEVIQ